MHDAKLQLTQETSSRAGGYTNNFGFDNAGNATNFKGLTQTFNSKNQNTANTFDLNGNPTTYKGSTLAFDAGNRMTSFGSAMTAGYTAGGLRAWKQNASGRTYQLYAGGVIPVCQLDSSGNVISANTVADTGLLATRTSASAFYAFDVQGSASHRLDGSGSALSASVFDAFGVRVTNDTSGDPFAGFGGQNGYRSESETGLQLLGLRYYDPASGTFLNRDPIKYDGGLNLYNYTYNNPIGSSDASGLAPPIGGLPGGGGNFGGKPLPGYDPGSNCMGWSFDMCDNLGISKRGEGLGSNGIVNCASLIAYARKFGLTPMNGNGTCPPGSHHVRAYVRDCDNTGTPLPPGGKANGDHDKNVGDHHWYRRWKDGHWSSKHGGTLPTDTEGNTKGKMWTRPQVDRDAKEWEYNRYCGEFCVPNHSPRPQPKAHPFPIPR